jgi:hypothetical protein
MYKNKFVKVLNIKRGEEREVKKKYWYLRGREEENTQKGIEIKTDITRYETMLQGKGRTWDKIVKQQLSDATDTQEFWVLDTPHKAEIPVVKQEMRRRWRGR